MEHFAIIVTAAILIEALVEYAKTIMTTLEDKEYKLFVTQVGTVVLGILIALIFGAKIFSGVLNVDINPTADIILSGIIMSRGSNYVSDFISRIKKGRDAESSLTDLFSDDDMFFEDVDDDEEYIEPEDDNDTVEEGE